MDCLKDPNFSGCPSRMDDGRHFTDYRANTHINSDVRYNQGIYSGAQYRQYLTRNAVKLMNENSQEAWKRNGCGPCKNLCLGFDNTERPGNSTQFNENSCIPPADFFRYVGTDGTKNNAPEFAAARPSVPSGHVEKS